jgi:NADH-quinone oxidoreductase subunit N
MLAYSSIAHAGYALMGLVAFNHMGAWALLFYMLIYAFMNLGAFGFVILLESKGYAGEKITDYAGLARRHPGAALGMLIFMLALAGIPPTAGFMGKLYLFAAAVEGGYVLLTVIAVIMSAVSLYYYLQDGEEEGAEPAELLRDRWTEAMIAVCIVATMVVGVWPTPIVGWVKSAAGVLGMM